MHKFFFTNIFSQMTTLAFCVLLLTLGFSPQANANDLEKLTIQFHWKHQFEFAGFYAAAIQGYYKEEGLDVTLKEGGMGIVPIDEVISGKAELGIGGSEVVLARLQNKPVVALAPYFQHSASTLVVRHDSHIYTPQDLAGRKVEMGQISQDAEMYAMLRNEGIQLNQITHVDSSFSMRGLAKGNVDAVSAYVSDQPFYLKERGIAYRLIRPLWYGIDFYGLTLFTSEKYLTYNQETVDRVLRATARGWEYAFQNPGEIIDYITKLTKGSPFAHSKAHLYFEYEKTKELMIPDIIPIGHLNPGRFKHMADIFVSLGLAEAGYSLEGFSYTRKKEHFSWNHWIVKAALLAFAIFSTVTLLLLFFNRRLRGEIQSRLATEKQLAQSEERLSLVLQGADLGYWDWHIETDEIFLSDRAAEMLGLARRSLQTSLVSLEKISHVAQNAFITMHKQIDTGLSSCEWEQDTKGQSGTEWILFKGQHIHHPESNTQRVSGTCMDISMLKAYQHELEELSTTDSLTGIPNRRYFFQQAEMQFAHARKTDSPLTVALLDLDHFKVINDTHGHLTGDRILKEFSWLLHSGIRPYDVLARFGGEEFIIMFVDTNMHQAKKMIEQLRQRVNEKIFQAADAEIHISFSAGLADSSELTQQERLPRTLIAKADKRLYVAKHSGRDKVIIR